MIGFLFLAFILIFMVALLASHPAYLLGAIFTWCCMGLFLYSIAKRS